MDDKPVISHNLVQYRNIFLVLRFFQCYFGKISLTTRKIFLILYSAMYLSSCLFTGLPTATTLNFYTHWGGPNYQPIVTDRFYKVIASQYWSFAHGKHVLELRLDGRLAGFHVIEIPEQLEDVRVYMDAKGATFKDYFLINTADPE